MIISISNAARLSLKLSLPGGQNISSNKWPCDLFFNEDSNISPMIFYSQPRFEHKFGKENPVRQTNFTFHEINVFSLNLQLDMFLNKLILGLKTK